MPGGGVGEAAGACCVVTGGVECAVLVLVVSGQRGWKGGGRCAEGAHAVMETLVLANFKTVRCGGWRDLGVQLGMEPLQAHVPFILSAVSPFLWSPATHFCRPVLPLLLPVPCLFLH